MTVVDATIISRKLAGFSGAALTDNLALGSGTRNTPAAVQSFLLAGCGATGGTFTSITAGSGLTGGTITASGTIAADTTYLQRRVTPGCAVGSFITAIAADGTPTCATPSSGAGGTVTSITAGTGLTGGTITGTGTVAVNTALVQSRVTASCAAGSSIRAIAADGTVTCQIDNVGSGGSGTVTSINTGSGLTGGPISTTGTIGLTLNQLLPTTACAANQIAKWSGSAWICAADDAGPANAFVHGGNTFALGAGVASVLGNNDSRPLTVKAPQSTIKLLVDPTNGDDGLRISYATNGFVTTPNTINGSRVNLVAAGVYGATIGGGGNTFGGGQPNQVNAVYGTVGGGRVNQVSSQDAVVAGGALNTAGSGGNGQSAQTVGGGSNNVASGGASTVPGGELNTAAGDYSFAAGRNAQANHHGAFVWGDSTAADVTSTAVNQFVIRANGGIRLPGAGLNEPGTVSQSGTNIFTHVVPATGPCRNDGPFGRSRTAIDHPLLNGKADAIVVVTPNIGTRSTSFASYSKAVNVMYDDDGGCSCTVSAVGRWMIVNPAGDQDMVVGLKFNVFVINP